MLASLSERSPHCHTRPCLAALGAPWSAYMSDLQCSVPANAERYLALDLYSVADTLGCLAVAPLQVLLVLEGPGEESAMSHHHWHISTVTADMLCALNRRP